MSLTNCCSPATSLTPLMSYFLSDPASNVLNILLSVTPLVLMTHCGCRQQEHDGAGGGSFPQFVRDHTCEDPSCTQGHRQTDRHRQTKRHKPQAVSGHSIINTHTMRKRDPAYLQSPRHQTGWTGLQLSWHQGELKDRHAHCSVSDYIDTVAACS